VHNIYHQLTPSLLSVLDHAGVPAVLTVHDYKLICPNYRLYAAGEPCTRCVRSHPWHTVRLRCHQASAAASTLVALETALHRLFNVYGSVQRLIVPSRFLQQMLAAGGYAEQKIHLLQHPVPVATPSADALPQTLPRHMHLARAFLFAGRLEEEKGVRILLRAAQLVPELPVLVAGEGSLRAEIEGARVANVHLLGKLAPETLAAIRDRVRGELVPSLWPEPFGMSAAEAMGAGRAVIASDRGALPELVVDGHTGLLVPAANPQALAQAMKRLAADDQLARSLGNAGRKQIRRDHDPQRHLAALLATYHNIQEEKA
jgi:glycosyltransferase involved in cell wall biosynthesis